MTAVDPSLIYALFKGEPGTRKSTQALSFPTPQYWFSWDRKMNSLIVPMRKWNIDPILIDQDSYDNWDKARIKLESFQSTCKYATLVFDTLTSCADMTLRQSRKSKSSGGKKIGSIQVDDIEDYNAESAALNELIALTKDIQDYHYTQGKIINIILIAHVLEVTKTSLDNKVNVTRSIVTAGKRVSAKIPAYCSEVYHFGMEKSFVVGQGGDYIALTEGSGDDFARTALDLPKSIKFGSDKLYDRWIKPAIETLKQQPQLQTPIKTL